MIRWIQIENQLWVLDQLRAIMHSKINNDLAYAFEPQEEEPPDKLDIICERLDQLPCLKKMSDLT